MKKVLVFILLLIATAETFVPCCQVDDCPSEQLAASPESDDKQEGNCSPFFACITCPGIVAWSKPIQLVLPEVQLPVHYTNVIASTLSTYSAKLFQPPRIA